MGERGAAVRCCRFWKIKQKFSNASMHPRQSGGESPRQLPGDRITVQQHALVCVAAAKK